MKKPLQLAVVDIDIESAFDSIETYKIWNYKNQSNEQIQPTKYADDHL